MKKTIILIAVVIFLFPFLCSCSDKNGGEALSPDYASTVSALEAELERLRLEQTQSDAEKEKRIAQLTEELNKLKSENQNKPADTKAPETEQVGFKYTVHDGQATVTGYVGTETDIVIPNSIDGYRVTAIGDGAFEDMQIKSVIIPDGVISIGWFAFNGCMRLTSVTVPSSVKEIGYSAFGSPNSSLTVYCHSESYALAFAKSFGIAYAII